MNHRDHAADLLNLIDDIQRLIDEDHSEIRIASRQSWSLVSIAKSLREISSTLDAIRAILASALGPHLSQVRITLMPKSIQVGQTSTAHLVATKSDGSSFPITAADTVVVTASNPSSVTIAAPTFNSDGSADVVLTAVAADPGNTISATVDGTASNTDTLTITAVVTPPAAVTLTLQ